MKRCPECRRDYYDETLLFCLDDGTALLDGPSSDQPTAILIEPPAVAGGLSLPNESPTQILNDTHTRNTSRRNSLIAGVAGIMLVATLGIGSYLYYSRATTKQIDSVAVMPFRNESGNADLEYLSDGMTDTLISNLSQLPNLNVKARSSVFRYKGKETDPKTIGNDLSVQAVLNGRVVQRGQDLLLNIELIDARTENVLWSHNYHRRIVDLIALQSEIARDVSARLVTKLSGTERQQLEKKDTEDTEAYNLYLRGRYHFNKRTLKDIQRAIEYLQQAVARDSSYALAFAALADSYAVLPGYSRQPPAETAPRAREAALRALSLDDNLSEAHASLALIMNGYDYDFVGSEREFRRAIELNPKNAAALVNCGYLLVQVGRFEEGLDLIRGGLELEPLSLPFNRLHGFALYQARRFSESEEQLRKTVDLDPTFVLAHYTLSTVYYIQGKYAEAAESYARGLEAAGDRESAEGARKSFDAGGWEGFERFRIEKTRTNRPRVLVAGSYLRLGEKGQAFQQLESAIANRESFATLIKVDPLFDPLRDDPRFQELLRKVGFPE